MLTLCIKLVYRKKMYGNCEMHANYEMHIDHISMYFNIGGEYVNA